MKKAMLLFSFCLLNAGTFSQNLQKDSLAHALELERLNKMGDSLHQVQVQRDSAFREKLDESIRSLQQSTEEKKQREIELATDEVLERQRTEQNSRFKTAFLTIGVISALFVIIGIAVNRRK